MRTKGCVGSSSIELFNVCDFSKLGRRVIYRTLSLMSEKGYYSYLLSEGNVEVIVFTTSN